MNRTHVIAPDDPAALVGLLADLQPADLATLDAQIADLGAVREFLGAKFGAPAAGPAAWREAVRGALASQGRLLDAVAAELAKVSEALESQKKLAHALADRVQVQSELLSKRAEAPAPAFADDGYRPAGGYAAAVEAIKAWDRRSVERSEKVAVADDPEADLPAPAPYPSVPATAESTAVEEAAPELEPEPLVEEPQPAPEAAPVPERPPEPSRNGHVGRGIHGSDAAGKPARGRANRLAVLKVLADGPVRFTDLVDRSGVPRGSMVDVLASGQAGGVWERVEPLNSHSPYRLTDKGRKALADEGYVVPPVGPKPAPGPILKAPGVTDPPSHEVGAPVGSDATALRCRLIAAAVSKARCALAPQEIARATGLDVDAVNDLLRAHSADRAPSAPGARYWAQNPSGTWKLTNAGHTLAEGAK